MNEIQRTLADDIQAVLLLGERNASYGESIAVTAEFDRAFARVRPALEALPDLLANALLIATALELLEEHKKTLAAISAVQDWIIKYCRHIEGAATIAAMLSVQAGANDAAIAKTRREDDQ